jgi:NADH dehydrogenase [ubiquinone] 1 alpha subcomplex assembly factor 5
MALTSTIFNRDLYKIQQEFAAKIIGQHDFLFREVEERLLEKLHALKQNYDSSLAYGFCELTALQLNAKKHQRAHIIPLQTNNFTYDEELITLGENRFDLIISFFTLQYSNDLLGSLIQYHNFLNPGGIFAGVILGGNTLGELRTALSNTDLKMKGGLSPRVIPMIDLKDAARLLQKAGFNLPISDVETIKAEYQNLGKLHDDLKGMGQANCLLKRNNLYAGHEFFKAAESEYCKLSAGSNALTATFDVVTFLGRK